MQRLRHIGKWVLGGLGVLAVALTIILALLLYTPPGLRLVGRMVSPLSGGTVRVEGLEGQFPNRLQVARLEISDSNGVWLTVEQATLRWSALAMIANHVAVQEVSAARVAVLRRPVPSGAATGETPRIDIEKLSLPRIALAAPVIGHTVTLSASGAAHYVSVHQMEADLLVTRAGNSDRYRVAGGITADVAHGTASIQEGADGILGKLAGLPGLGPVNLAAQADGDAHANRLALTVSAGPLRAQGGGTIALATRRADIDLALAAPAMTPQPDIAWQSLSGAVHFHGGFDAPALQAHLRLDGGKYFGLAMNRLSLDVSGDAGHAKLDGTAEGITLPGDRHDQFARIPVRFQAQADLKAAARPVTFAILHPLAKLQGTAETRGGLKIAADLTVPSLAPFAAPEKVDMRGSAGLHIAVVQADARMTVALDGKLDIQGTAIPARLLGRNATVAMQAVLEGGDLSQSRIRLQGAAIATDVEGSLRKGVLNYRLALDLKDLSRLTDSLQGTLSLHGDVHGPLKNAALSAGGAAVLATKGFARQRISIALQAQGLPAPRQAELTLDGRLNGAPLLLHAALKDASARQVTLAAHWRSLDAKGDGTIGSALSGKLTFALRQLADIAVFTGGKLSGAADATVVLKPRGGKTDSLVQVHVRDLRLEALAAQNISLHGAIGDVTGKPLFALAAEAQGLAAQGFSGGAQAKLDGPLDRLAATFNTDLKDGDGAAVKASAAV